MKYLFLVPLTLFLSLICHGQKFSDQRNSFFAGPRLTGNVSAIGFPSYDDGTAITQTSNPIVAAQWHYAGNNGVLTSDANYSWDWIYSIVATDRKEYVACGYTTAQELDNQRSGIIFKLDHYGQLVWSKPIINVNYGSTTLSSPYSVLWQVTKASDGYVAVGFQDTRLLVVEVDEDGNFLNGTPRSFDFPTLTAPDLMMSNVSSSLIDWAHTTQQRSRGNAVAIEPIANSVNKIIVAGQLLMTDVTHSSTQYDLAYLTTMSYSGGAWSFDKRLVAGDQYNASSCGAVQLGGNRILKIKTGPITGGAYDIYACGSKSGVNDHQGHCGIHNLSGIDDFNVFDKDAWLFSIRGGYTTINFNRAYNKNNIRLDGTFGSGPFISTVNSTTYPHNETGPLSARNFDPSTGYINCEYGGTVYNSPATLYCNSDNNMTEEAQDFIFTSDGKIAVAAAVNLIGANSVNNGYMTGSSWLGSISAGSWSGMALGWGKEYEDVDGFILKCDMSGELAAAKNVGHFSGKVFNLSVGQDPDNNLIVTGSTADKYGGTDYNLPDPHPFTSRAFIVVTDDNYPSTFLDRRSFAGNDSRATEINYDNFQANDEYDECIFGMAMTADGGFVIAGNNELNGDDFTATKFAPYHQAGLLRTGGYSTFGNTYVPAVHTVGTSESWTSNMIVGSRVVVPNGHTLTISGCTVSFAESDHLWDYTAASTYFTGENIGCGIFVEVGGRLVIDHATLQGLNTTNMHNVWDGIVVKGTPTLYANTYQGIVTINSSSIRDARYGIYAADNYRTYVKRPSTAGTAIGVSYSSAYDGYGTSGGGRIYADNTLFENCRNGANLQYYPTYNNGSSFTRCTFNTTALGVGDINFYTDAMGHLLPANTYLAAWAIRGIEVHGNTFTSDNSFVQSVRPKGVIVNSTLAHIGSKCNVYSFSGSCISGYIAGNSFSNLSCGVISEMPAGITMAVGLYENTFDNNFQGINVQGGVANLTISKNDFKIPEGTTGWNPTGVTIAGADGYDVSANTFERCSTCSSTYSRQNYGIVINNGHMNNTLLNKNTFEDVMVASNALGLNGTFGSSDAAGLQFKCNNYDLPTVGIARSSIFSGGPAMTHGRINPMQGMCLIGSTSSPAGNQFTVCGSPGGRIKIMDYAVDQHVDYYNNGTSSIFDPGSCVDFTFPGAATTILLSNIGCTGSTNFIDACPSHNFWDPPGNVSDVAADFQHRMSNSTDPTEIAALRIEQDHFLNLAARYYVEEEQYDSAAALMASYNKYRQALPMYIMAGDYTNAQNMVNLLPLDSLEDSLFAWQAQLAVDLYSRGLTYYDLDSASSDSMAAIAQYDKAAGYMAGACAALINTGYVTWPIPAIDSILYDSLLLSQDTSLGAKMAHNDGAHPSDAIEKGGNFISVFPNPSSGALTCTATGDGKLTLNTVLGQLICMYTVSKGETQLSLPKNLAAGMYLMKFVPKEPNTSKEFKIIYQP